MKTLNKRILWVSPSGGVSMTIIIKRYQRKGETEDQYIQRIIETFKLKSDWNPQNKYFIKTKDEIKEVIKQSTKGHLDRLKVDVNGKLSIDESIVREQDTQIQLRQSAKSKLISGKSLTQQEADSIIN